MRKPWVAAACLGAAALHHLSSRRLPVGAFNDDAFFILLSKSLRRGFFGLPDGAPVTDPLPGFPALLMLPSWLVEPRWHLLKPLLLACAALAVFLTWRLARRFLPDAWALACGLLVALNPVLVGLDGIVIPDIPYLALSLALFLGAQEVCGKPGQVRWPILVCLAGGAALAALMRPQGALLALCLGLAVCILAGRTPALVFTAGALAPLAAWMGRNLLVDRTVTGFVSSWKSQFFLFEEPGRQAVHFVRLVGSVFGEGLVGAAGSLTWSAAAGFACLGLAGFGAVRLVRERKGAVAAAMASYVIMVLALHSTWPLTESRYLLPMLPMVCILILAGARHWLGRRPLAAAALLALPALASLRYDLAFARRGLQGRPAFEPETMAWLRRNTPKDARIESLSFHCVQLFAERRAVPPGLTVYDRDTWVASALVRGVDYLHVSAELSSGEFSYPSLAYLKEPALERWARSTPYAAELYSHPREATRVFRISHPDPQRYLKAYSACLGASPPASSEIPAKVLAKDLKEALKAEPGLECASAALRRLKL
ncbi:MAG: hypothetical protein HY748_08360 [Elusimicrobia bacterium]|nr:hypothetical protein [Elusimicrobiota bacterium]